MLYSQPLPLGGASPKNPLWNVLGGSTMVSYVLAGGARAKPTPISEAFGPYSYLASIMVGLL